MRILAIQPTRETRIQTISAYIPHPYTGGFYDSSFDRLDVIKDTFAQSSVNLLSDIPFVEVVKSYTEALIKLKESQSYDLIISTFTPREMLPSIDLQRHKGKLFISNNTIAPRAMRTMNYFSAFEYLREISSLRASNKFIIYTGFGSPTKTIINYCNRQLKNYLWIPKSNADDKQIIEDGIREMLSEFQLSINSETGKIEVIRTLSRSPVKLDFNNKDVNLLTRPHFFGKTLVSFQEIISEFSELLNKDSVIEEKIHKFLEAYPELLLGDRYKSLRSKVQLKRENDGPLIPDFILEPVSAFDFWKIIDIKLPNLKITKNPRNRSGFNAEVFNAVNQLKEYRNYFNNPVYRRNLKNLGIHAYKPSLSVIIGLDYGDLTYEQIIDAKEPIYGFEIMTFNELIEIARNQKNL